MCKLNGHPRAFHAHLLSHVTERLYAVFDAEHCTHGELSEI
ncbi:MAG: hypothetical protein KatS3mg110_2460 [Pirellulaceae bacterium]|nr:MAG: hypothetical protein KatS3mg110_2460 [Pirellulaceae bacterium]